MPPIAVELPEHIVTFEPALAVGLEFTVIVIDDVPVQPLLSVTVSVYVVVEVGLAVGLATVVELSPVEGDHA